MAVADHASYTVVALVLTVRSLTRRRSATSHTRSFAATEQFLEVREDNEGEGNEEKPADGLSGVVVHRSRPQYRAASKIPQLRR